MDEIDAPRISAGQPVRISLDALPGKSFPGKVKRVAPYVSAVEKQARTVDIEATFDSKISVTVQNLPFKTRLSRSTSSNFDLVISGWSADFADPISFLDLFTSTNPENNGKWKNATYDKLIADSKTTSSTSKRWSNLTKAENILLKDAGVAPLYYSTTASLIIRPSVKGVIQNRGT